MATHGSQKNQPYTFTLNICLGSAVVVVNESCMTALSRLIVVN